MSSTREIDFLIVGQGLAGTLLAHFLQEENQKIQVVDWPHTGRSSNAAAGIINPITGRHFAKSWRFDELFSFAKDCYLKIGQALSQQFWFEMPLYRALHGAKDENEWLRKSGTSDFNEMASIVDKPAGLNWLSSPNSWGEVRKAARVAIPQLLESYRNFLRNCEILSEDEFDYNQVHNAGPHHTYKGTTVKTIVFCEGYRAIHNPFFNHLPLIPNKGHFLQVEILGTSEDKILKNKLFYVPQGDQHYWIGTTNEKSFKDIHPNHSSIAELSAELENQLKVEFKIKGIGAGIRPTVVDRRPLLGIHTDIPNLAIFNGLGTKGALLGPYFAKQMARHLLGFGNLDKEVDIQRFEATLSE